MGVLLCVGVCGSLEKMFGIEQKKSKSLKYWRGCGFDLVEANISSSGK